MNTVLFYSGNYLNGKDAKEKMRAGEVAGLSHRLKADANKKARLPCSTTLRVS